MVQNPSTVSNAPRQPPTMSDQIRNTPCHKSRQDTYQNISGAACGQSKVADKEAYKTPSSAKAFSWRGYVRGPWFKDHKSPLDLEEESQDLNPSTRTLSFNFGNIRHT